MNAKDLGQRLRSARESRGLSQQAVAHALSLPRTAVTQLEAGTRSVSTLELTRLSEFYLHPVADLLHEGPRDEDRDVLPALHRAAPVLEEDPVTREQVARCVHLCREGVSLERLLDAEPRSGPPSYEMRLPRSPGEAGLESPTRPLPTCPNPLLPKASGHPASRFPTACQASSCGIRASGWPFS